MADTLAALIEKRRPQDIGDYEQGLREVIQEFILLALWRGGFFNQAAFYGGTALRLLYGLDRFSEDLDFTLLSPNPDFSFNPWYEYIRRELNAQGLDVDIEGKEKSGAIQSAFLKTNTRQALLKIGASERASATIHSNSLVKVKFEADIDPPLAFVTENRLLFEPIPFSIKALAPESLFAGKYHALLERDWKQRVKGRDWYDLVFFVRKDIPVQLGYLSERLKAHHEKALLYGYNPDDTLTACEARRLLEHKITQLDIDSARDEVYPFVRDKDQLSLWSLKFFTEIAHRIRFVNTGSDPRLTF
jgi:predicted nucleotidyltransferase component of viral defense system